ncbi:hypothetical protein CEXT_159041 [Caerostris extrusa]|uniref:Secreted protein n=1 Tax=Caerostris extrusa TaxID=172846 RepID=A0AAV4XRM3_CAEEX|nr:hypothetical protein CEXT_159041 [Caerostris extrusa]
MAFVLLKAMELAASAVVAYAGSRKPAVHCHDFGKPPYPAVPAHCCFHKPCVTANDHLSFLYGLVTFPCRISWQKCLSNVVNVVRSVTNRSFTTLAACKTT